MRGGALLAQKEGSRFAKVCQGAADVLKNPKVRREAERLAKDPRVQRNRVPVGVSPLSM
jgi:hypothetical protein